MTRFVGCIDIHAGHVKQIVGGSLDTENLKTNYVAVQPSSFFAQLYRSHHVTRSHVIKLGPGCDEAAIEALQAWPKSLQVGGGITANNAASWIERGASKVIVTSYLFPGGNLDTARLKSLTDAIGKEQLVIDLSCRRVPNGGWVVAMDRWQRLTEFELTMENLNLLAGHCSEFLVHAADVEGLCQGVDKDLVRFLADSPLPVVYAGGGRSLSDLELVHNLSGGRVDLTFGSALDIFGGSGVKFEDAVDWNKSH